SQLFPPLEMTYADKLKEAAQLTDCHIISFCDQPLEVVVTNGVMVETCKLATVTSTLLLAKIDSITDPDSDFATFFYKALISPLVDKSLFPAPNSSAPQHVIITTHGNRRLLHIPFASLVNERCESLANNYLLWIQDSLEALQKTIVTTSRFIFHQPWHQSRRVVKMAGLNAG